MTTMSGRALAHPESSDSFSEAVLPAPSISAEEICAAVAAVDDKAAQQAFAELPKDDEYDSDEEEDAKGGERKKRSWLGKMGKRLFKGWRPKNSDDETKKLVMACRASTASAIGGYAIQDPEHARLCRNVITMMVSTVAPLWHAPYTTRCFLGT